MSAFDKQIDGDHYLNLPVQPVPLAYGVFGGDSMACKIAKYLSRRKDSWEKQIKKAEDCFDMYLELTKASPIPIELTCAQIFMLDQFLLGIPEQIREHVKEVLLTLVCLRQERSPEECEALVHNVRDKLKDILKFRQLEEE